MGLTRFDADRCDLWYIYTFNQSFVEGLDVVSTEVEELTTSWERFVTPLRLNDGVNEDHLASLTKALVRCAEVWRDLDQIPRSGVHVLVGIVPAMDNLAYAYEEPMAARIREAMVSLQELVWECVAVD